MSIHSNGSLTSNTYDHPLYQHNITQNKKQITVNTAYYRVAVIIKGLGLWDHKAPLDLVFTKIYSTVIVYSFYTNTPEL